MGERFTYDGSPECFLTALSTALTYPGRPDAIETAEDAALSLFGGGVFCEHDSELARALSDRLRSIGGKRLMRDVLHVFLAEEANVELIIYDYVHRCIEAGCPAAGDLSNTAVARFVKLRNRVGGEVHRFKGLLRFEELDDGLLWASFEPDHNISCLLAPYFAVRMPAERFLICDVKRETGIYYDSQDMRPVDIPEDTLRQLKTRRALAADDPYARLWRQYFDSIAIGDRRNRKLQMNFMPKKYWTYLTEQSGIR